MGFFLNQFGNWGNLKNQFQFLSGCERFDGFIQLDFISG